MHVYNLRVKREKAGKAFPFDRVYLAKNGDHKVFKQLFRYALIMPVEQGLKNKLIEYVKPESFENIPYDRPEKESKPEGVEWDVLLQEDNWVMCVPILPKYVSANMPRYLTAAGKYRHPNIKTRKNANEKVEEPFPTLTYLQTPEKNIRPVCVACPRFIMHQNGHCQLGEAICYESLAMGTNNSWEEGMGVEEPPANILESDD